MEGASSPDDVANSRLLNIRAYRLRQISFHLMA